MGASKLLVVDASVVRAAGESNHPVSSSTRHFLNWVLELCHRVVLTPEIRAEWRRHQSKLARRWRLAMYARKQIVELNVAGDPDLRLRVVKGRGQDEAIAILKDLHLIEAALETDGVVVSRR